jgi:penicillin-binding protein 1A
MRSCYEDESLNISKDEFTTPEDLSIEVDCELKNEEGEIIPQENTSITPDIDF